MDKNSRTRYEPSPEKSESYSNNVSLEIIYELFI